ncbi:aspartic peptidase domain-containing protein [Immersiella caudata]|uniref:Aspartic peptidase domain-containing protein n=1 Tax=Immersiella caudata TaxID=314043 RepID=A0AA39U3C6_9PEZI|nr:aspartic peptidase domain-containing protein [Immersiella caudata]
MAPSTFVTALLTLAATGASGLKVEPPRAVFPGATTGQGFISIPVSAPQKDSILRKRADVGKTTDVQVANFRSSNYVIDISIGTPPQKLSVAVDTGSFKLWVNPDCSKSSVAKNVTIDGQTVQYIDTPLSDPAECRKRGNYDPSISSTTQTADMEDERFSYADSTTVDVGFLKDRISIGGLSIDNQIFGVAKASNQTGVGIMGFGPPPGGFNNSGSYPMILTSMARQGVINSPAFSMHLGDLDNSTGTITFGGVDKKKYQGGLIKIPFRTQQFKTSSGQTVDHTSYYVNIKSIKLTNPGTDSSKSYDLGSGDTVASLDCGSTNNILPKGLTKSVCDDLKGTLGAGGKTCNVDCALRQQKGGMTFGLDGKDILVPFHNLIEENTYNEVAACHVMMNDNDLGLDPETHILGAPFLRSSYAVFDWGNGNLHIAQAANCGTNIVAIGTGADAVPGGNGECSFGVRSAVNYGLMLGAVLFTGLSAI